MAISAAITATQTTIIASSTLFPRWLIAAGA